MNAMIYLLGNKPSFGLMSKRNLLVLFDRADKLEKLDFGFELGLTRKITQKVAPFQNQLLERE